LLANGKFIDTVQVYDCKEAADADVDSGKIFEHNVSLSIDYAKLEKESPRFSFDKLKKPEYADTRIKISSQKNFKNPHLVKVDEFEHHETETELSTIGRQLKYMDGELSSLKKDSVDYAINIEIQDFSELVDQLEKIIHPGLYIRNDRDLLRHIDLIGGVNTVQMYLKAKDGITGNHQENENVVAVNANLSEGSSDWICVGGEENIDKY
jgi:hypothetical protein